MFKKNGLDVNLIFIPGGPTAAASMLAGEVQAVAMAGPAVVTSNLAGTDLVMIAGMVNTFAFQIVTVKGITSAQQLKGKRVGVNRFGTAPDIAARFALRRMGIDPSEVTILQLGEQSTRLLAMKAGQLKLPSCCHRSRRSRSAKACTCSWICPSSARNFRLPGSPAVKALLPRIGLRP